MCEVNRKAPCYDCPFRTTATPGWLGAATPRQFLRQTIMEMEMPCHVDVDYEDENWKENSDNAGFCAGSLIFFRNIVKSPRSENLHDAVEQMEPSDKVFQNAAAFLEHHLQTGIYVDEPTSVIDPVLGLPEIGTNGKTMHEKWTGDMEDVPDELR